MSDETEEGCGWEWDHSFELFGESDGVRVYHCRECGAEIIEFDDD